LKNLVSSHLSIFSTGAILLEGQLLSTTKENTSRNNKIYVLGTDSTHDGNTQQPSNYKSIAALRFYNNP
jgi:hypothetical protein